MALLFFLKKQMLLQKTLDAVILKKGAAEPYVRQLPLGNEIIGLPVPQRVT
jgi:hypothetical protein